MSEHDFPASGRPGLGPDAAAPASGFEPTAGAMLRDARQAQGVHIAALAAALKVPVEKLEALEQDRFDLLLDAAFARALASGVCRLLKLDPTPVLQRLPPLNATKVTTQNRGINETFRSRGEPGSASLSSRLSKPVILGGIALLLGAAVLVFLPMIQKQMAGKFAGPEASSKAPEAESPASAESATVQEPVQNAAPTASSPADESRLPAAPEVVPSPVVPPASAPVLPAAPASAPIVTKPVAATLSASSVVTFSAKEASWINVTDAKGVTVLQRLLQAGEAAGASGTLPLRVVVGKADAVQVQVRGQAFDLNPLAKSNVARFEVK